MFSSSQALATGTTGQRLTYSATRRQVITAVEARDATSICSIQVAVGVPGSYTAALIARGDQDRVGDQVHWSGRMVLEPDEEIIALFYGATLNDRLELTVRVERQ